MDKRINTINFEENPEVIDYELPHTVSGPYVVDDSCFVPMSEAIKQLSANQSGADSDNLMYDFKDGKDTGIEVPLSRRKDVKDIAEVSSAIMDHIDETSEKIKKDAKRLKDVQQFESELAAIKANSSPDSSTTSQ